MQPERAVAIVGQVAVLAPPEVLALHLEVRVLRIAVGRVLPDEIGDGELAVAVEAQLRVVAR